MVAKSTAWGSLIGAKNMAVAASKRRGTMHSLSAQHKCKLQQFLSEAEARAANFKQVSVELLSES
jgi:hypothetical protein